MDFPGEYALRLVTGAILCGTVLNLTAEGTHRELLRILCGIILTMLFLGPVAGCRYEADFSRLQEAFDTGKAEASAGTAMAREEQIRRIAAGVEAYILDKARREGARLTVSVTLGEDMLPETAALHGRVSPKTKEILSGILERELGIAKENQLWTG